MNFTKNRAVVPFYEQHTLKRILLVMKLTTLLLIIALVQASAKSYSQVTLNEKNAPLEKVLRSIEGQTGYTFIYDEGKLNVNTISVTVKNATIDETLNACFNGTPVDYKIVDKNIVLQPRTPSLLDKLKTTFTPPSVIHGKVLDENGQPLPGATVKIKGTNKAMVTNDKGEFALPIDGNSVTLTISYISYAPKDITVNMGNTDLVIRLQKSDSKLDEVKIIGYGTETQRYSVGDVAKVTAEDIAEQPVSNPLLALEGRVPGLVVTQTSGLAGTAVALQIRGQNSLAATATGGRKPYDQPLVIVDGVPFAPQTANINLNPSLATGVIANTASVLTASQGIVAGMSAFEMINPSDIESIEVLKDAEATSIYGSRGSNGVILITTKKGQSGKARFQGSISSGVDRITKADPLLNTQQYLQLRREYFKNSGVIPTVANAPDVMLFDTTRYSDYEKYFLGGTAHRTSGNFSLSGGSVNTSFLIGSTFGHDTYIIPGDFADDLISLHTNFQYNSPDKRLKISFTTSYAYNENNSTSSGGFLSSFTLPPDYPDFFKSDGSVNWNYKGYDMSSNPFGYLKQSYSTQNSSLNANLNINFQIIPGLTVGSNFGYNNVIGNEYNEVPQVSLDPASTQVSNALRSINNYQTWIIEPQVNFIKRINRGELTVLIGGTFQQNGNSFIQQTGTNYTNDALLGSISAAGSITSSDGNTQYRYNGFLGRLGYIWDLKYLLSVTARRDGSSRFGPGNQFGNFGSVGAGWIFSEEPFFKKLFPFLNFGKIRANYGTSGSDQIGDYQYIPRWQPGATGYQGVKGYIPQNLNDPDYQWSSSKKLDIGLDLELLKNRMILSLSFYQTRTDHNLTSYSLPDQTGFTSVVENFAGVTQNRGLEISLSTKNIKTKDFSWNTSFNTSFNRNILLAFPALAASNYAGLYTIGQPLNRQRLAQYIGVNPATGLYQFLTAAGVPTYGPPSSNDLNIYINPDPKFAVGVQNSFAYKNFRLDLFIDIRSQLGVSYLGQIGTGATSINLPVAVLDRWQNPGDQTSIQKFSSSANTISSTTGYYTDASFIRLRTAAFSYRFPTNWVTKIGMAGCSLSVNAQNLFTITDYKGSDPETQTYYGVPPLKTVVAQINFTF